MSEQLRHKMFNFEAAPPAGTWEAIASRLQDDEDYSVIARKMGEAEIPPPPGSWNNIMAELDQQPQPARPYSFRRAIRRLSVAAILVGMIFGAWWLFNNHQPAAPPVAAGPAFTQPAVPHAAKDATSISKETITAPVAAVKDHVQTTAIAQVHQTGPAVDVNTTDEEEHRKFAMVDKLPSFRPVIHIPDNPITGADGLAIRDMDVITSSNYITVMGPNGQLTRISTKFANMIRYLDGSDASSGTHEYLDSVLAESDTWKKRFQEWRSRISQSPFIPSSANFLDIISFKELIQEK